MINSQIRIDSLKLRVPRELYPNLFTMLSNDIIHVDAKTGVLYTPQELNLKEKIKERRFSRGAVSITVAEEKIKCGDEFKPHLTFKVTAKHLTNRYYEGITHDTVHLITDFINSLTNENNNIKLTTQQLLSFAATDVDFCKDLQMNGSTYKKIIEYIRAESKASAQLNRGFNVFDKANNQGVEFSSRRKATPNNPFLKLYNKKLDSESELHSSFFEYYGIETPNDLYRIEFTLKNKAHFAYCGIEGNTLNDLLNLTQPQLEIILGSISSIHIRTQQESIKMHTPVRENTTLAALTVLLQVCAHFKYPVEKVKENYLAALKSERTKYRQSRLIDSLHQELANESRHYSDEVDFISVLRSFGLA